jgi:hypothetical protein
MSPMEVARLVGHSPQAETRDIDIVEWGRRWQKAWTSHNPKNENANCIGDSFGQLTHEIERLRTALRSVRATTCPQWRDQLIADAPRESET